MFRPRCPADDSSHVGLRANASSGKRGRTASAPPCERGPHEEITLPGRVSNPYDEREGLPPELHVPSKS